MLKGILESDRQIRQDGGGDAKGDLSYRLIERTGQRWFNKFSGDIKGDLNYRVIKSTEQSQGRQVQR